MNQKKSDLLVNQSSNLVIQSIGHVRTRNKAFTLIELLVVIVIIGILATIGVAQFNGYQERARMAKELAALHQQCTETIAACVLTASDQCITMSSCLAGEVTIGSQIWKNMSINEGEMVLGGTTTSTNGSEKYCYDDTLSICDIEGGMYNKEAAENLCPSGYRLPTRTDAQELISYLTNKYGSSHDAVLSILSVGEWPGATNSEKFNATLSGEYTSAAGFRFRGETADSLSNIGAFPLDFGGVYHNAFLQISCYDSTGNCNFSLPNYGANTRATRYMSARCFKE